MLDSSERAEDGLLNVTGFYPESFDRVLLDPPCSALGLRPKLDISHTALKDLLDVCMYQRKFISQAVQLLQPGGIMTYSTCTFHADENERMVAYMIKEYQELELVPVLVHGDGGSIQVGQPGLPGLGLTDMERGFVRRFDPWTNDDDDESDTIGFFIAKFRKRVTNGTIQR
jgi:methyltransferase NSUN6